MLHVTWEWIGIYEPALDLANTVAIERGIAHDLLAPDGAFERWAAAAARSRVIAADEETLVAARPRLLDLRGHVRAALARTAAGEPPPRVAVAALNAVSASAPEWTELGRDGALRRRSPANHVDRLLAAYARSTIEIVVDGSARLRVCGAPSCGMYYRPNRRQQRWCSVQCGTRARVARHYQPRRARRA